MTKATPGLVGRLRSVVEGDGPKPPWTVVGITSISTPSGDILLQTAHGGHVNEWSRQKICDAVNSAGPAAALIEQLQAKLSELQQELGEAQNRIETDQKLIDSLEAKLSERDADAGRYRFLKSMTRAEHSMDQYDGHLYRMGVYDRNMVGLDAAIDAARKE